MRKLILILALFGMFGVFGCAIEGEADPNMGRVGLVPDPHCHPGDRCDPLPPPPPPSVVIGDTTQQICGATACGGLEGEPYNDCMNFHCGSDTGGGEGGGGGGGGGYGENTCVPSCTAGVWTCSDGVGGYGQARARWGRNDQKVTSTCLYGLVGIEHMVNGECISTAPPYIPCGSTR